MNVIRTSFLDGWKARGRHVLLLMLLDHFDIRMVLASGGEITRSIGPLQTQVRSTIL